MPTDTLPIEPNGTPQAALEDAAARQGLALPAVDPQREYVAAHGSSGISYGPYLEQLGLADDDLENTLGADVFQRMSYDETIAFLTRLRAMMVLRRPLVLESSFADADEGSEDFKIAAQWRDFCERACQNLEKHGSSLSRVLFELYIRALPFGNAVGEITLEFGSADDRLKYWLRHIKTKPRQATAFVVDPFFNCVGLATWTGGYAQWLNQMTSVLTQSTGGTLVAGSVLGTGWQLIPRDKFIILTPLPRDNDPRGLSAYVCIFNAWRNKFRRLKQLDTYSELYAVPFIDGETAPNASPDYPLDPLTGQPDKTKEKITPEMALLDTLKYLRAGEVIAHKNGSKVTITQPNNDGGSLLASINFHNAQITFGLTGQLLATGTTRNQTRASSTVHQDMLGHSVQWDRNLVCDTFKADVLNLLMKLNYGPGYEKYVPNPSLGRIDIEDLAVLLMALARAVESGLIHYSMLPDIWQMLGLPRGNIQAWMEDLKRDREMLQAGAAPATGKDALPGQTVASKEVARDVRVQQGRAVARKLAGRQKAAFSQSEDVDEFIGAVLEHVPDDAQEIVAEMLAAAFEGNAESEDEE